MRTMMTSTMTLPIPVSGTIPMPLTMTFRTSSAVQSGMTFNRDATDPRVIIADGYGVRLTVNKGHVVIYDGNAENKRERRLSRVDAKTNDGIARIIVLAETGYVSLEVLRWCKALNIGITQLDRYGDIIMMSPGQTGDPRVLRAQVLAGPGMPYAAAGAAMMSELLTAKITGQADIAETLLGGRRFHDPPSGTENDRG
jgi:hypothetical protein